MRRRWRCAFPISDLPGKNLGLPQSAQVEPAFDTAATEAIMCIFGLARSYTPDPTRVSFAEFLCTWTAPAPLSKIGKRRRCNENAPEGSAARAAGTPL